jgi:endonuclease/exonuclease/phosphatase family metal-dependent hydrolase/predicted esterase
MRSTILFILFFILMSSAASFAQEAQINFMSYNIRYDNPGDKEDNWHHRKKELVEYIQLQGADFLGVQEALSHQVSYLDSQLLSYDYIGVGRDDGLAAGEFMALFYDREKWTCLDHKTIWLSETPGKASRGWDAACHRVVTFGTFLSDDGQKIKVFNTHLDHRGEEARKNSLSLLEELIEEEGKHFPVVLMGDFNFTPDDPLYDQLTSFLQDCQLVGSKAEAARGTFNAFRIDGDYPNRIDYILHNEYWRVKDYQVGHPLTKNGRQLSDHFPVMVKMKTMKQYLYKNFVQDGDDLPYRLLMPEKLEEGKKYPLLLFLHGSGERGRDNEMQLVHGGQLWQDSLDAYPAIVILPQCPWDDYWSIERKENQKSRNTTSIPDESPGKALGLVMQLVDDFLTRDYVDEDRFYAIGLSMGGMGVFELAWRMPDKMAAAVPICGEGDPGKAPLMKDIAFWIFHGSEDSVVPPQASVQMLEAIQRAGGKAKISMYPGVGHNSWDRAFAEENLLKWVFGKRR